MCFTVVEASTVQPEPSDTTGRSDATKHFSQKVRSIASNTNNTATSAAPPNPERCKCVVLTRWVLKTGASSQLCFCGTETLNPQPSGTQNLIRFLNIVPSPQPSLVPLRQGKAGCFGLAACAESLGKPWGLEISRLRSRNSDMPDEVSAFVWSVNIYD